MVSSSELPFFGVSRHELVVDLLGQFKRVRDTQSPRFVLLEADSGWGKSRIIHEFYRQLASEQQAPSYWPPSILEGVPEERRHELVEASGRRKRIYPESGFSADPGSAPEWFWWGISATASRAGTPIEALANDLRQIVTHGAPLIRRLKVLATGSRARQRRTPAIRREDLKEIAFTLGSEVASIALSVSGLSLVLWAVQFGQRKMQESSSSSDWQAPRFASPEELGEQLAQHLGEFAEAGLPVVIAIEDVHEASPSLVEFLIQLVEQRRGPILVLATAWPGKYQPTDRLRTEISKPLLDIRPLHETDPHLPEGDLEHLAASLLPETNRSQRRALARHFRNVLALEVACGLRRIKLLLEAGQLTPERIREFPTDLDGLWGEEWKALSPGERNAIYLSLLAAPASIGDIFPEAMSWDGELPVLAASGVPWGAEVFAALSGDLDEAVSRAWIRRVNEWMRTCHEPAKFRLAHDKGGAESTKERTEAFWASLAEQVRQGTEESDESRRRMRARLLTALAMEGCAVWDAQAIGAADSVIAELADAYDTASLELAVRIGHAIVDEDPHRSLARGRVLVRVLEEGGYLEEALSKARHLTEISSNLTGWNSPTTLQLRHLLAGLQIEAKQFDSGLEALRSIVAAYAERIDDKDAELRARESLASGLRSAGYLEEAVRIFREVLSTRERGASDEEAVLSTRHALMGVLSSADRISEAIVESEILVASWTGRYGSSHPKTTHARLDLAGQRARAGEIDRALEEMRQIIEDAATAGDDGIAALEARHDFAKVLKELGRFDQAVTEQRAVLEERIQMQGPDHPATFHAMSDLASSMGESGEAAAAVGLLRSLLEREEDVHGRWDHRTLGTRRALASWLWLAGLRGEALETLESLVGDLSRIHGRTHPLTIAARISLTEKVADRSASAALAAMEELAGECAAKWGELSPEAMGVRRSLARLLGQTGRDDLALSELERLIQDSEKAFGARNVRTLDFRHDKAERLSHLGRLVDARVEMRSLISDRMASQGPSHWETLHARSDYAMCLSRLGDKDGALREFDAAIRDAREFLGEGSKIVLDLRHLHADTLLGAGKVQEALAEQRDLVDARTALQGASSPETLHAVSDLANTLERLGRIREAIGEQEGLVRVLMEEFGEDDPDTLEEREVLASRLGRSGDARKAVSMYEEIVGIRSHVHGSDDPRTLECREVLATWLDEVGEGERQLAELAEVVDMRRRLHAPNDPRLLESRRGLAQAIGRSGDAGAAVDAFASLVDVHVSLYGGEDLRTLEVRASLAAWLGEAGRGTEALSQLDHLAQEFGHVLDLESPPVVSLRVELAEARGRAGDIEGALQEFAKLVEISNRVFDSDARKRLGILRSHARWLMRAGRIDLATPILTTVLEERRAIHEGDHPSVLQVRRDLAEARADAGDADEGALARLLEDYRRVYSAGHPEIEKTQQLVERATGASK